MPCYHPLTGYRSPSGQVTFSRSRGYIDLPEVTVSCGQCVGCRLERSRQWAVRCMHEAQLHRENCFLTLTFDDEHCPEDMSLDVTVLQKFLKRLRKRFDDKTIRFYACGEYGEKYFRPHYHLCVFGHDFEDKVLWKISNGCRLYVSSVLNDLWPYGYSIIGDVTFDSAAYVARYIMKKITGEDAKQAYWRANPETGEAWEVKPEFNTMSRGGRSGKGIGYNWYQKYKSDVYPSDNIHVNGQAVRPPRYYDTQFQIDDEEAFNELKTQRILKAKEHAADNTPQRLQVKKNVKLAQITALKRTVE